MNFKLIYLLLILLLFTSCKKEISATIKLKIELENKYSSEYPDLYQLKIYKNGKLFKNYIADKMPYIDHEIILMKLKGGKYQFEYENFFKQKIIKSLFVDESKTYNIVINPDYTDYKRNLHYSIIEKLVNDDSLKINFESRGCFHSGKDSLVIKKINGKYILKIDRKNINLESEDVNYLKKIECELYELPKNGDCTTSDIYTLISKNRKLKFIDNTCRWNAWSNIYKKFIWKEKNGL